MGNYNLRKRHSSSSHQSIYFRTRGKLASVGTGTEQRYLRVPSAQLHHRLFQEAFKAAGCCCCPNFSLDNDVHVLDLVLASTPYAENLTRRPAQLWTS
jgi:hypothetical protein